LKETIAIIGAGNGGRAFAAYLAQRGYDVILCYRTLKNIKKIKETAKIMAKGQINETFDLTDVTDDYQDAVSRAEIVLLVVPANAHESIIKTIAPVLKPGQIILLNPGRTWGAIHAFNLINSIHPDLDIFVGETQTLYFTCRKIADVGVDILRIKEKVAVCFYPESNNIYLEDTMKRIFPNLNFVDDIRITSLNNIGAMIHPATVILNAGSIDRNEPFLFYKEGMTEHVVRILEQIDKERCTVINRMGLEAKCLLEWLKETYDCQEDDLYNAFRSISCYSTIKAPDFLETRYLTEDVPTGLVPIASIGDYFGIETPMIDSIIRLVDGSLGTNYFETGRTIENIKLPEEILERDQTKETSMLLPGQMSF